MSVATSAARARQAKHRAESTATRSPWPQRLGRAGMATRGALYLVVAWLAVEIARGHAGTRADQKGALASVARQPLGRALVGVLALGFVAYAAWRLVEAVLDPEDKGPAKRAAYFGRGVLYVGFFATAVSIMVHGPGKASGNQQQDWTARVLRWPIGRELVAAVGLVVIGTGVWNVFRAVSGRYRKELKPFEMSSGERPWIHRIAVAGLVGRGLALLLCGGFLVRAALRFDPETGVGLDPALHQLAAKPHGPLLLVAVAIGLAAFGGYQVVLARYRRVLSS